MAKEYYIRTITAGRYCKTVRYRRSLPSDSKAVRLAKRAVTNKAQRFINLKNATEKLQFLLCANFDSKESCFCTFTFDNDHLPANRKHTQAIWADFLRSLREEWKRQGRELKYIYTIEGEALASSPNACPVDGIQWEIAPWRDKERWEMLDGVAAQDGAEQPVRLHAHCFLPLRKGDYEAVRAFWRYGHVYINQMRVNEITTFQRLAFYVTKEKRCDEKPVGAHSYVPSRNLTPPAVTGHWCSECETVEPPQGAEVIHSGRDDTFYTSFHFCYYRLPRQQQPSQRCKSKGRISSRRQ